MKQLFDNPADMEPLMPDSVSSLSELSLHLIRKAERLGGFLHPITRQTVAGLVCSMNSYYSNLIEGHRTRPRDIDDAVAKNFSANPSQRSLQIMHVAHMEAQLEMEGRLSGMKPSDVCAPEFLRWLHEIIYRRLPSEFCKSLDENAISQPIVPGALRQVEVSVGRHLAPTSRMLDGFLRRFSKFYGPQVARGTESLVVAAAAHHRLAWIHPFLDGNGRVARLFTHAWFVKAGISSDGLWTISRGLARYQPEYRAALANADQKRVNDFDGRGYLSQRFLHEFCHFFLTTAIDQVEFMLGLLDLDRMQARILGYAERKELAKELPAWAGLVLRECFQRGEIGRGEVSRIIAASPRTGQKVTGELLAQRLLTSPSPKGPLRLGLPAEAAGHYFPNLYPAGAD